MTLLLRVIFFSFGLQKASPLINEAKEPQRGREEKVNTCSELNDMRLINYYTYSTWIKYYYLSQCVCASYKKFFFFLFTHKKIICGI